MLHKNVIDRPVGLTEWTKTKCTHCTERTSKNGKDKRYLQVVSDLEELSFFFIAPVNVSA